MYKVIWWYQTANSPPQYQTLEQGDPSEEIARTSIKQWLEQQHQLAQEYQIVSIEPL